MHHWGSHLKQQSDAHYAPPSHLKQQSDAHYAPPSQFPETPISHVMHHLNSNQLQTATSESATWNSHQSHTKLVPLPGNSNQSHAMHHCATINMYTSVTWTINYQTFLQTTMSATKNLNHSHVTNTHPTATKNFSNQEFQPATKNFNQIIHIYMYIYGTEWLNHLPEPITTELDILTKYLNLWKTELDSLTKCLNQLQMELGTLTKCLNQLQLELGLSLIHIWRCRRKLTCRSRWSPYH